MKYIFQKYKFTTSLFSKRIDHATVEQIDDTFQIKIMPFFSYGGKYYIIAIAKKDNDRIIYATKKSHSDNFDAENFEYLEDFFVSLSHDGKKVMIFKHSGEGIILIN